MSIRQKLILQKGIGLLIVLICCYLIVSSMGEISLRGRDNLGAIIMLLVGLYAMFGKNFLF